MKKIYLFILALGFFGGFAQAQDTTYIYKKASPVIKVPRFAIDSLAIKKPRNVGFDTLLVFANAIQVPIYKFATAEIDSIGFRKPYIAPVLTTFNTATTVALIGLNTAKVSGSIAIPGGLIIEKGIVYGTTENPTVLGSKVANYTSHNNYSNVLTGLEPSTQYYARAYAINLAGVAYGPAQTFTTLSATAPTVSTLTPFDFTAPLAVYESGTLKVAGEVTNDGGSAITESGVYYNFTPIVNPAQEAPYKAIFSLNGNKFSGTLSNSIYPNNKIYVRAYAKNAIGESLGNLDSLMLPITLGKSKLYIYSSGLAYSPKSITLEAQDLDLGGILNAPAALAIHPVTIGFSLSTTLKEPSIETADTNLYITLDGVAGNAIDFSEMKNNVIYYIRSFVSNEVGISYSAVDSVFTDIGAPSLKIISHSRIADTCYFSFEVSDDGGSPISAVFFNGFQSAGQFNLPYPTENLTLVSDNGLGVYHAKAPIASDKTLQIFAYAENAFGKSSLKNGIVAFIPLTSGFAVFEDNYTTVRAIDQIAVQENITADGGNSITARGIKYNSDLALLQSKIGLTVNAGDGSGVLNAVIMNLDPGTTYYYYAFATNSAGTTYTEIRTTSTLPLVVGTTVASNLSSKSVTLTASILDDGGKAITESGFVYSTSSYLNINSPKIVNTLNVGSATYFCNMVYLLTNTTYYVRAYAKNSAGTEFGEMMTFTTFPAYNALIINKNEPVNKNTFLIAGTISAQVGNLGERGVVYSQYPNPTVDHGKVISTPANGVFSAEITGLVAGKQYYVRAYGINEVGVFYSPGVNFTTPFDPVILSALSISNLEATLAQVSGSILDDGKKTPTGENFDLYEYGCMYSSQPDFNGGTTFRFTSQNLIGAPIDVVMTNLLPNTKYYVKMYGQNSSGTFYSETKTFVTNP